MADSDIGTLVRLLKNPVKEYQWGFTNRQNLVAKLSKRQHKFYAELWIGEHKNGQSFAHYDDKDYQTIFCPLSSFLKEHNYQSLSFMMKILSIQKSLSLQTHPTKEQAIILNKENPKVYGDDNDKPEIFYTLTEFESFLGYVNQKDFERLRQEPIFKRYFKGNVPKTQKQVILGLLSLNEQQQKAIVQQCLQKLSHLHPNRYNENNKALKISKIPIDFPNDIGIVISFFLEYKVLPPGKCYFIQPNVPHAYISGEALEMVKNSDNVIRLGLTPKLKDLSVAQKVLKNEFSEVIEAKNIKNVNGNFETEKISQGHFEVLIIRTNNSCLEQAYTIEDNNNIKVCLILEGSFLIKSSRMQEQEIFNEGEVLLMLPDHTYTIRQLIQNIKSQAFVGWATF